MAVNVDTVYKTVLYILNKEQRGYITPDEFNRLSTQVQLETFEQYFEELNQQLRVPENDSEYANRVQNLDDKIAIFKTNNPSSVAAANVFTQPVDLHRIGAVVYNSATEVQRVQQNDLLYVNKSPLTSPTTTFPIYTYENDQATVYPTSITSRITFDYIKKPTDSRWGYSVGSLGQYIYDDTVYGVDLLNNGGTLSNFTTPLASGVVATYTPDFITSGAGIGLVLSAVVTGATAVTITVSTPGTGFAVGDTITINAAQLGAGSTGPVITLTEADFNANSTYGSINFELHPSEQVNLILQILLYSGVVIRDPQIIQVASQMVQQEEANEKS